MSWMEEELLACRLMYALFEFTQNRAIWHLPAGSRGGVGVFILFFLTVVKQLEHRILFV